LAIFPDEVIPVRGLDHRDLWNPATLSSNAYALLSHLIPMQRFKLTGSNVDGTSGFGGSTSEL
jgi:hypothetical protein